MGFYAITALINGITSSILGPLVYLKNRKRFTNKLFALFCLSVAIWSYAYFLWQISSTEFFALFWCRVLMAGAIFIPIFYLHFILSWVQKTKEKKKYLIFGYLIFIFFFFSNFTSLFVNNVSPKLVFSFWPNPGILYHPFLVLWIFYAVYIIYFLIKELRTAIGILRSQLRYILIGTIVGVVGGMTNYFLWYDIPIPPLGNWTSTFYVAIISYAIVKYRLMDIRVAIGKTAVYIFSFATVVGFGLLLAFLNNLLANPFPYYIVFPFVTFFGALIFKPCLKLYEKLASRYFYYTFYSHQKVLGELGEKLTSVLELGKLTSLIADTLIKTMKLDKTGVLLREPKTGDYRIQKIIGFKEENGISLVRDNFLTAYLQRTRKPVVYEELGLAIRDIKDKTEKEKLEDLRANMKRIEAKLCLPLFRENEIMGMIVLGRKLSGEPYSKQDIQLLTALSNQASIALENANLYAQVQDLSQNLQKKVDEQTEEIRRAYEVEKKARKELERLDKAKSQFMLATQHHLRTPLTSMQGYLDLILQGSFGKIINKKVKEKLARFRTSTKNLINIVEEILNISQFQLGRKVVSFESNVPIEPILEEIISELMPEAEKKGIYLKLEKPEKLPKIRADAPKLKMAIFNIIDNAIKYTEKGGVTVKLEVTDSNLRILTKDTGIGIGKEQIKNLFDKLFERGEKAQKLFTTGRGIGLFIASKIIQAHHGKIWAESEGPGKGSTFYIELPINQ